MLQKILLKVLNLEPIDPFVDYVRIQRELIYQGLKFEELMDVLQKNPVSEFLPIPKRTFGVEIEGVCKNKTKLKEMLESSGIKAELGGYNGGRINLHFHIGTDSSIVVRANQEGGEAIEVTSPKLIGWGSRKFGFEAVKEVLNKWNSLNENMQAINDSCGFHVHIGTGDYFREIDYLRLAAFTYIFQPYMFGITPPSRWCNQYTKPLVSELLTNLSKLQGDRYLVLNFKNVRLRDPNSHVEFRIFSGTTNVNKAESYVLLSLEIVEAVRKRWWKLVQEIINIEGITFEKWLDLLQIKGSHPVKRRVRELLLKRYQENGEKYKEYVTLRGFNHRIDPVNALKALVKEMQDSYKWGKTVFGKSNWDRLIQKYSQ